MISKDGFYLFIIEYTTYTTVLYGAAESQFEFKAGASELHG